MPLAKVAARSFAVALLLSAALGSLHAEPIPIIFDTDMGSDCDDAGALALLHHYADAGRVEILACIYSSGRVPYGAGVIEAINRARGRPDIPVGATHRANVGDPVDKMRAEVLAREAALRGNRIVHNRDAAEQTALTRRVLAAAPDARVVYVTVGHTQGLHDLLVSAPDAASPLPGRDLIRRKVARWVALGGLGAANPDGHYVKDWNFWFNDTAPFTTVLLETFPVEAVFVDAGEDVLTGRALAELPTNDIVRRAYETWLANVEGKTRADQRPSWDLAAIYYAVEGTGEFLTELSRGRMELHEEHGNRWRPAPDGKQRMIVQRAGVASAFADDLNARLGSLARPLVRE